MASFKALCLAGVACLAVTASAYAADLLPPPPPVEAPYIPAEPSLSGWYLRGDVGAGTLQLSDETSTFHNSVTGSTAAPPSYNFTGQSTDEQVLVDLGAGYQFNSYFRADVTGEYRFGSHYQATATASGCTAVSGAAVNCIDGYVASISNAVFLVNGYIDLGTWYHVTPYIGAGVGVAMNRFGGLYDTSLVNGGYGYSNANTHTNLAYALMAGFSYDLTPNLKLDIGYRYLDMGHAVSGDVVCQPAATQEQFCFHEVQSFRTVAHDIRLGLRYTFDPAVYIPQQMPIISKY